MVNKTLDVKDSNVIQVFKWLDRKYNTMTIKCIYMNRKLTFTKCLICERYEENTNFVLKQLNLFEAQ